MDIALEGKIQNDFEENIAGNDGIVLTGMIRYKWDKPSWFKE